MHLLTFMTKFRSAGRHVAYRFINYLDRVRMNYPVWAPVWGCCRIAGGVGGAVGERGEGGGVGKTFVEQPHHIWTAEIRASQS